MFHQQSAAGRASGCVLVENDTYGELRYQGEPLPHPRIHRLFLESVA